MPWKDDRCGGATAPQGLPLSWGQQTHLQFCLVPVQCPGTSYLQLMVAAHKVERENEETWGKVRDRAVVTTTTGEGMAELSQQIAKLMAALTKNGQGSSPSSTPGSPQECSCRLGTVVEAPQSLELPQWQGWSWPDAPSPQPTHRVRDRRHREPGQWSEKLWS